MPNYNILPGQRFSLGIDCASRPYGPAVKSSPYSLVCRYLSDGGSGLPGKLLLPDEAKSYLDNDVAVVSNWETTANMMLGGYNAGAADARSAWAQHKRCGGPDNAVVYFSCDFDVAESQQATINAYLQGCIDYLGVQSVGIYGGYWVCKRAKEYNAGVHLWQTLAWSGGNIHPDVNLLQRIGTVVVNGCQCDVNEIRTPGHAGAWQDVNVVAPQPDNGGGIVGFDTAVPDPGNDSDRIKLMFDQLLGVWDQLGGRTIVDAVAELLKDAEK